MAPASSKCEQSCVPMLLAGHSHKLPSVPVQASWSSQMGPDDWPNGENRGADIAPMKPSCVHTTFASFISHASSHTEPHVLLKRTSTRPCQV